MSPNLRALVADELRAPAPAHATAFAAQLAARFDRPAAVLFYGSVLRTGDLDGVMDFYVLTHGSRPGARGLLGRWLWPDVSYHEITLEGRVLRAKVASLPVARFAAAVCGRGIDTTVWTRFVQPAALVWVDGPAAAETVIEAVAEACRTAARFAAALGPERGPPEAFWTALFQQTYAAEFRVERRGRERSILAFDSGRYDRLLTACWAVDGARAAGLDPAMVAPDLSPTARRAVLRAWRLRRRLGKPLNLARLVKAAFTFEGAARYAAWKIERHTGLVVPLTPWRERHPILAAPGVLWSLWRRR